MSAQTLKCVLISQNCAMETEIALMEMMKNCVLLYLNQHQMQAILHIIHMVKYTTEFFLFQNVFLTILVKYNHYYINT